jgi:hypothetical protein
MALVSLIPHSIRPDPDTKILGVGKGSGAALTQLFKLGAGAAQVIDIRARSDAASGKDARVLYARLHQYGAGGGEAVRAYAFAANAAAATGGTLNGLHASLSIDASMAISGAGNAIRATLEAAADTRTLGGTLSAVQLDSNVATGNTMPATAAFMRVTDTGAVRINKLLNLPTATNSTLVATHVTDAMTHSIKCVLSDGTDFYIMCTTTKTNRGGGS